LLLIEFNIFLTVITITIIREGSEFTAWRGGGLYVSASKIKPAPPLPEAKKISVPPAGDRKFYHDFTIEK